ncbi:MAG: NADH-quinone oxidoreductase subunit J [Gammaproteobacteria bacterium]|nr:NADH-quinone oxidoreductase subunit J [Gammaproteobacteria bacterium]
MSFIEIIFYVFASILVLTSLGVILFKNPVYSAISLILSFITSAALWLLLQAEFLAIVLILVYVGAVMVLFLFVVMMLNIDDVMRTSKFNKMAPFALFIGLIVVAELITLIWFRSDQFSMVSVATGVLDSGVSNTTLLGTTLFTDYLYLFEIAGFILLLAIIVSISLTMRRREGLKRQIVSEQINIDQTKRMKLVDLKNERN